MASAEKLEAMAMGVNIMGLNSRVDENWPIHIPLVLVSMNCEWTVVPSWTLFTPNHLVFGLPFQTTRYRIDKMINGSVCDEDDPYRKEPI